MSSGNGKYKIGTIVALTGFSRPVLRAWEKRYALLEPERGMGGHRLYTEEDLQVLRQVRKLVDSGLSIGEIASFGREELARPSETIVPHQPMARRTARDGDALGSGEARPLELDRLGTEIVEAATEIDGRRIRRLLDEALSKVSSDAAIEHVMLPAAREIGRLWAAGRCSVAGEHVATGIFAHRLRGLLESRSDSARETAPLVACACLPDELHEIGCLLVALQCTRIGMRVVYLGANLPFEDLEIALSKLNPVGVHLSVSRSATLSMHREKLIEVLGRWRGKIAFLIGGQALEESSEPELSACGAIVWPMSRPLSELSPEIWPDARSG